jgi:hypothetical protein
MTALFSTAYFPPVLYVAMSLQHTNLLIEAKETFPKQTYRNRMEIMTAGGVRTLTVPVVRNNHSRTDEVLIDYKERWNIIHLRTIEAAYAASPYYLYYKDDIEALLMPRRDHLLDLNQAILEWILKRLKINSTVSLTTDYTALPDIPDYRNAFSPKHPVSADGFPPYYQVFGDRQLFAHNLSILDLMMNLGLEAGDYLNAIKKIVVGE